jgi:SAM-dependent methyltransferase
MMNLIRKIRAFIVTRLWPKSSYWLAVKSVKPLSQKFGFDRGNPIDRYWIESFLTDHKRKVKGRVLEVVDSTYSQKFDSGVTKFDVVDLDPKNKQANIIGNLKNLTMVKDNTYDCIILTQVLGMIDDYDRAIKECHRILKKGGYLLVTSSCFSSLKSGDINEQPYWRFTPASGNYMMKKHFKKVTVKSYGNVLSGQCFWAGLAQEELTKEQLEYNDPSYPCLLGIVCQK